MASEVRDEWRYDLVDTQWTDTGELRIDARNHDGCVYSHVFDAEDASKIAHAVIMEALAGGSDA